MVFQTTFKFFVKSLFCKRCAILGQLDIFD